MRLYFAQLKKRWWTIAIAIFVVVGVVFILVIFGWSRSSPQTRTLENTALTTEVDAQHQRFTHPRYGFSIIVPADLHITRTDEGQTTETITFEPDVTTVTSSPRFQIFVTPYLGTVITDARIKKDIPSGTVSNQTEVLIGPSRSIRAVIFQSSDALLGDTREVWFIRNGYLFEVTTRIAHDAWLAEILDTWFFLDTLISPSE